MPKLDDVLLNSVRDDPGIENVQLDDLLNSVRELVIADPGIENVVKIVSHVILYRFNGDLELELEPWSCKGVEGCLFVVERADPPLFKFIVLNRRNAENLVEDLSEDFAFRVLSQYMVYQNKAQEFNGIWFSSSHVTEEVAGLFTRILSADRRTPLKPVLTKSELTELKEVPTSTAIKGSFGPAFTTSIARDQLGSSGRSMDFTSPLPNLDKQRLEILNLSVLQRKDSLIKKILIAVPHASCYEFNGDLKKWSFKGVEGCLFVVERTCAPFFQLIVLNKISENDMVEDLLEHMVFGVLPPYMLYQNAAKINGIWFSGESSAEEVADIIDRTLGADRGVPLKSPLTISEFTEHEVVPTSRAIEGSFGPAFTTSEAGVGASGSTLMNFVNTAATTGCTSSTVDISELLFRHPDNYVDPSPRVPSPLPSPPPFIQSSLSQPIPYYSYLFRYPMLPLSPSPSRSPSPGLFLPPGSPSFMKNSVSSTSHVNPQPPHGTPLAQPPPPSTSLTHGTPLAQPPPPSTSLPCSTPIETPPNGGRQSREKVQGVLTKLVQDDQFISQFCSLVDQVHQAFREEHS